MKKKLLAILLVFAMLFSLTACGGEEEEKAATDLMPTVSNNGSNAEVENTAGESIPTVAYPEGEDGTWAVY